MSMKSADLLPALRELPGEPSGERRAFREIISDLTTSDRAIYAAEATAAASFADWDGVFVRRRHARVSLNNARCDHLSLMVTRRARRALVGGIIAFNGAVDSGARSIPSSILAAIAPPPRVLATANRRCHSRVFERAALVGAEYDERV